MGGRAIEAAGSTAEFTVNNQQSPAAVRRTASFDTVHRDVPT
jgi:hypothetical protein